MARIPAKPVRRSPGPTNTSRGAGEHAPASAAATAPFYHSPDEPQRSPLSGLAAADSHPEPIAEAVQQHATRTRAQAIDVDAASTADASLSPHAQGVEREETYEEIVDRIRKIRKPLGSLSQKLALPPIPGYHQHWFNDESGRVDEARENGWAHVQDRDGKPLKRPVGTGRDKGTLFAYAMKLPIVFWQEDMDARHALADQTIKATKANPFMAQAGSTKPADAGKFYSPVEAAPLSIEKG